MIRYFLIFIFCFSINATVKSQYANLGVPTFPGSDVNLTYAEKSQDLTFKIEDFIAENTASEFVERHFTINDSIELTMQLEIGIDGFVIKEKTEVLTQYEFVNKYFTEVINSLPKFTPARNLKGALMNYPINLKPKFEITAFRKLRSISRQLQTEMIEDSRKLITASRKARDTMYFHAVLRGCNPKKPEAKIRECFIEELQETILSGLKREKIKNGKVYVSFIITESAEITNINITGGSSPATRDLIRDLIQHLKVLIPAKNKEGIAISQHVRVPINIIDPQNYLNPNFNGIPDAR